MSDLRPTEKKFEDNIESYLNSRGYSSTNFTPAKIGGGRSLRYNFEAPTSMSFWTLIGLGSIGLPGFRSERLELDIGDPDRLHQSISDRSLLLLSRLGRDRRHHGRAGVLMAERPSHGRELTIA